MALLETDAVSIYDEPKIDCHNHLLDPAHFGYAPDAWYHPVANEQGTAHQLSDLFDAYGSRHALLVGPNSGYDTDNRCLLDFLERGNGRFKGVAVVDNQHRPQRPGAAAGPRRRRHHDAGLTARRRAFPRHRRAATRARRTGHVRRRAGRRRPTARDGADSGAVRGSRSDRPLRTPRLPQPDSSQPGFRCLLDLATSGRYFVKISGLVKCSATTYPWEDSWPYVQALLEAFTPDRCMWGSDWPFLRAPERIDYGLVLALVERLIPDPDDRRKVLWDTPMRLFGFDDSSPGRSPRAEEQRDR